MTKGIYAFTLAIAFIMLMLQTYYVNRLICPPTAISGIFPVFLTKSLCNKQVVFNDINQASGI
jgi:hypothetical protein